MKSALDIGLGELSADIVVCIGNRPPLIEYEALTAVQPVQAGEVAKIAVQTGNHWRKIFNIYAKLMFELKPGDYATWQDYREQALLQEGSKTCLLFSDPKTLIDQNSCIVLIAGKTYAQELGLFDQCVETQYGIYKHGHANVLVTPYFDYRQLSNLKLSFLVQQIKSI